MPFVFLFYCILFFILGLVSGSFLNVIIYRLEKKENLKGRSYCPHCKQTLIWQDLIPVFSFAFLGGRCRHCHKKISWQYPVVEISTALIFLLIFNFKFLILNQFEILNLIDLIFLFYIACTMIVIFVYDLKHYIIPDKVLFPAIVITFLYQLVIHPFQILNSIFAVLIASGFFLAIFLISRGKWIGFGDVKLAILLGLILGYPTILVGLFLAFLFGAIIGLALMITKIKRIKSEVPFAPFLILGTFISILFGESLISWYLKSFLI